MPVDEATLTSFKYRPIGPFRGGRVVAVAGDPLHPMVFYFGACSGGVWKTTDGGLYWRNMSDGYFKTASVGAIAVAESDPNVIYVGMGEACIRSNVTHGDGVYRSTDAGKTWTHLGLAETRHIGRVRVHPKNPDIVYVAALGHAFTPSEERGVYRSTNGGRSWEKVLFRSDRAGAIDLSLDPNNPRIIYAAIWQAQRTPWSLESGGPDSSLYKSTDGGDTWTEITNNPGLPKGLKGRIGVAVSPAQADRVWAVMDAENFSGGLFRSDDGGANWSRVSQDRSLTARPWYYSHVFADPMDPETVYVLNLQMWKSVDGGHNFTQVTTPHGDNHDLWIDPHNHERMIEGNDGGACVSFDGGDTFSSIYNQPTAQFYHVTTDTRFPYRAYGTQQDNSAISVPSRTGKGAIPLSDCYVVGSSESGHIAVPPDNPNIVYSGAVGSAPGGGGVLLRYDHASGQTRIITVWPEVYSGWGAKDLKYRFQWTYPIVISPHDPNVLYVTGNQVFRSSDEGQNWEVISPDLTRNDVSKLQPSGGPVTKDTTGAEHYCTIFAFAESPHECGVLWAGSDDGVLHISRDAGANWQPVTPPDLPEWATISTIECSPHDPATAYLAAHRYRLGDTRPFLFKTNNYGKSWQAITQGIPRDDFTRVIREDPERRGLLYAGTEGSIYVSFDDGGSWQSLQGTLPIVPIHDLSVKDGDLVVATHGRSFWILDELPLLRQLAREQPDGEAQLFQPRTTYRLLGPMSFARPPSPGKVYGIGLGGAVTFHERQRPDGDVERTFLDAGENPPDGVVVHYYLPEKPRGPLSLTFRDAKGEIIKCFPSQAADADSAEGTTAPIGEEGEETQQQPDAEQGKELRAPAEVGMNRFVWNMRYPEAVKVPGDVTTERSAAAPLAPPGAYSVELNVNGTQQTQQFEILKDPRVSASQQDYDAQFALLLRIRDKLSETHSAINEIRALRQQLKEWSKRASGAERGEQIAQSARRIEEQLCSIEETLIQGKARVPFDTLNLPSRLNAKLAALPSVVASADAAPARQMTEVFDHLSSQIDEQLQRLRGLIASEIGQFNEQVREARLPAVSAPANLTEKVSARLPASE